MEVPRQRPHVEKLRIERQLHTAVHHFGDVHPLIAADSERRRQRLVEELTAADLVEERELEVDSIVKQTRVESAFVLGGDLRLEVWVADRTDQEPGDFLRPDGVSLRDKELQRRRGARLQTSLSDGSAEAQLIEHHQLREPRLLGDDVGRVSARVNRRANLAAERRVLIGTGAEREVKPIEIAKLLGEKSTVGLVLIREFGRQPLLRSVRR